MIPRRTLEIASFWDQLVCLDCEAIQPPEEVVEGDEPPASAEPIQCCSCCSTNLLPADTILRAAELVGDDE